MVKTSKKVVKSYKSVDIYIEKTNALKIVAELVVSNRNIDIIQIKNTLASVCINYKESSIVDLLKKLMVNDNVPDEYKINLIDKLKYNKLYNKYTGRY